MSVNEKTCGKNLNDKATKKQKQSKKSDFKQIMKRLKPYAPKIWISVALSVINVLFVLYAPILFGRAIDKIAGADNVDFKEITSLLIQAGCAIIAAAILQWAVSAINNNVTYAIIGDVRKEAFSKIQTLPLSYLDSHKSGEIVSKIIGDTDVFADGLLMGFTQLFSGVTTILFTLAFMFALNPFVAAAVVVLTPVSLLIARFISKRTHSMFVAQSVAKAEQTALIDEAISNQKVIRAFSQQDKTGEKFDKTNDKLCSCSLSAIFFSSLVNPTTRFINSVVYAAVCCFGALSAIGIFGDAAVVSVGMLSVLLSYTNQYTKPFNEISGVVTELQAALASARRVFGLIDEKSEISDENLAVLGGENKKISGDVSLENVCFSYTKDRELIKDFSLDVKSGQRIAIVGPTGCGKTTMINLLMRFYDVDDGNISVDGNDLRNVTRKSLRAAYGMVLQETWLKSGTIRDNLKMGAENASDEQILEALRLAKADDFVLKLPHGLDEEITEEGALSQGQKQLLCIARVMLRRPPMLILDEATSSIDTRTELKIQDAFAALMKGRTSFIVAHRLSTVREADCIIVMNNGKIIESGTHDELLKKGGFYSNLYSSQFA